MFTLRTIDTEFPPIPVVPQRFQSELEGGEKEQGEVQEKGVGLRRGGRTVGAGKRRALVHSLLAVQAGVAAGAFAHVAAAVFLLPALATVETGGVGARQQAVLTVGALKTLGARAHITTFQILGEIERERRGQSRCAGRHAGSARRKKNSFRRESRLTVQAAPFRQGLLSHSRISSSQLTPVKPGRQVQV